MKARSVPMLVLCAAAAGCGSSGWNAGDAQPAASRRPEALSLLGQPLYAMQPSAAALASMEQQLAEAREAYDRAPQDADAIIWLGRRLAYLGRYRDAIETFTEGIEKHPDDPRMYRHRGHRFITTRQFNRAIADLEHAAELIGGKPDEVEPDGQPNRFDIPTSTLHTNIWYHLALAHYLRHDYDRALPAWQQCVAASTNNDMLVAAADWLYMTLRRLGRQTEAREVLSRVTADMEILENEAYHKRLLMYKGLLPPDSLLQTGTDDPVQLATYGYGVANWYYYNGDRHTAEMMFRRILEGRNWAAFGYIAAESELAGGGR